jgi:RNA polymerase sigma-70 factor (ECF subfamily)
MNQSRESDEWLMGQVAQGKRECMTPLVRRYASPLLTFIQRMIGDRHRSEELFQEVFLAIWEKRSTYRFPGAFRSWLFAIAANRCRADFRRVRFDEILLDEPFALAATSGGPTPVETVVGAETAQLVSAAVAALPEQQRSVVVLRVWNGLSYREIAEILQCSEGTARSHMHHGLCAMRNFLEPKMR